MNVKDVFWLFAAKLLPQTNIKHFKKMMELMDLNELCVECKKKDRSPTKFRRKN